MKIVLIKKLRKKKMLEMGAPEFAAAVAGDEEADERDGERGERDGDADEREPV